MPQETLIILVVRDDLSRPWWEAMGLPEPERWNSGEEDAQVFPDAFVDVQLSVTLCGERREGSLQGVSGVADAVRFDRGKAVDLG
jgi:hypothetical protein